MHNGLLVCSLPKQNQLLFVDARGRQGDWARRRWTTRAAWRSTPRADCWRCPASACSAISCPNGGRTAALPAPEVLVAEGLEDPQQLALDAGGNVYVSDRGDSHQVKVFNAEGKFLRAIGHAGAPKAGPYDPDHMNNPNGLTIDANDQLWVAETDFQPKRVSVWTLDGKLRQRLLRPGRVRRRRHARPARQDALLLPRHGVQARLGEGDERARPRPLPARARTTCNCPAATTRGQPETPLYVNGKRYFTNCYNSNPTNGAGIAFLWLDRDGIAVPVAALGRANDWDLLKSDAFKPRWPKGVDLQGRLLGEPGAVRLVATSTATARCSRTR